MDLKIRIKTPKGQAKATERKIKPFIIPFRTKYKTTASPEDDQIIWEVSTDVRRGVRITRNVQRFGTIVDQIMSNKTFLGASRRAVGDKGIKELRDMLDNQTTVELIKE